MFFSLCVCLSIYLLRGSYPIEHRQYTRNSNFASKREQIFLQMITLLPEVRRYRYDFLRLSFTPVPPVLAIEQSQGNAVFKVTEGSTLTLTCKEQNQERPALRDQDFSWSHRSPVTDLEVPVGSAGRELTIGQVTRSDSGLYTCKASSDLSAKRSIPSVNASIEVEVQCKYRQRLQRYLINAITLHSFASVKYTHVQKKASKSQRRKDRVYVKRSKS